MFRNVAHIIAYTSNVIAGGTVLSPHLARGWIAGEPVTVVGGGLAVGCGPPTIDSSLSAFLLSNLSFPVLPRYLPSIVVLT